jgi:hypothetical protein
MFRKIFKILLTFILIVYASAAYSAENNLKTLISADSLFEKKQYTESMELYERCFHSGFYTPRMLIRLSLIKEGLGDYTYALYYLNVYYTKIPDKAVLKKMDELAGRYNLEGYEYNDLVFFISLYHRYYVYIIFSFLFASLLFLIYLYVKKREKSGMGLRPLLFMFILGAVYIISNYDIMPHRAIVNSDASLMSAPSSGAELVGHIKKGHRVTVKSRKDIWCKIEWRGQVVFVRENSLLFLKQK